MTSLLSRIDGIEARAKAATPGEWGDFDSKCYEGDPDDGGAYVYVNEADGTVTQVATYLLDADAAFIAHAHRDIPDLCRFLRAAAKMADAIEQHLLADSPHALIDALTAFRAVTAPAKAGNEFETLKENAHE